jgi:hypothetical protein
LERLAKLRELATKYLGRELDPEESRELEALAQGGKASVAERAFYRWRWQTPEHVNREWRAEYSLVIWE